MLEDGPIKKVEDLKGKIIATNAIGSAVDIASRAMLQEARPGGQARLHDRRGAVPHHEGDAEGEEGRSRSRRCRRSISTPSCKQIARALFTSKDAIGVSQFIIWAARKSFIDKNRAAMVDFMEDMLTHRALVHGPEEPRRGHAKIAAKITKAPPERFGWLFTKQDYYRNPDMLPNLDALQSNINTTHELGFIKAPLDVKKYTDLSLVQEAAKRLK